MVGLLNLLMPTTPPPLTCPGGQPNAYLPGGGHLSKSIEMSCILTIGFTSRALPFMGTWWPFENV